MQNLQSSPDRFASTLTLILVFLSLLICNVVPVHASACSIPNFKSPLVVVSQPKPSAFVIGDFNHDGKQDMVVADQFYPGSIVVRLGNGDGTFGTMYRMEVGGLTLPSIALGYFNADNEPDIIVANFDQIIQNQRVTIFYGNIAGFFGAPLNYQVGLQPNSVAVGDFNHDGLDDFATANYSQNGPGTVTVRINDGASGFGSSTINAGNGPNFIVAGQFTNDTNLDLMVAVGGSNTLTLLTGNGSGGFAPTNYTAGVLPDSIAVGDFNGDSRSDLAVTNYTSSDVSILLQLPTGGFGSTTSFPTGAQPFSVAVGDINSDGKQDLAVGNLTSNNVVIMLGSGTGSFSTVTNYVIDAAPRAVSISDFNVDGKPDVVMMVPGDPDMQNNQGRILIAFGDGVGGLVTPGKYSGSFSNPKSVGAGDFNSDGKPDMAVTNLGSNNVTVFLNNGLGGFGPPANYDVTAPSNSIVVRDFNHDNKADIVVGNTSGSKISILLGNGTGGFAAATSFNAGGSSSSVVAADFNLDNSLDLATLGGGKLSFLIGNGMGGFAAPTTQATTTGVQAQVGDLNGDGKPDVAIANSINNTFTVLIGDGIGGVANAVNLQLPFSPIAIEIGDFNADTFPDIAFGTLFVGMKIVFGNGTGIAYSAPVNIADELGLVSYLLAGDYTGDGKLDLAVANANGLSIVANTSSGPNITFAPPTNYYAGQAPLGTYPHEIARADFNGDGRLDLAITNPRLNSVFVLNATCGLAPNRLPIADFDGDGVTDLSVFRASSATWYLLFSSDNTFHSVPFGAADDVPVSGDYDGDSRSDIAVFRPTNGVWYYLSSSDGSFHYQQFGAGGDIPVPGDYDGDGKVNFAVWRASTGYWYTSLDPATNYGAVLWGQMNDKPAPADYDGDGKTDIGIFRPSTAYWYLMRSSLGFQEQQFGLAIDEPVPADFDGDGKADFAVFRQSTGFWYTSLNPATNYGAVQLGQNGDVPVPGYYDSDKKADVGVFRAGDWFMILSTSNKLRGIHFGAAMDEPAPSAIHHP